MLSYLVQLSLITHSVAKLEKLILTEIALYQYFLPNIGLNFRALELIANIIKQVKSLKSALQSNLLVLHSSKNVSLISQTKQAYDHMH